MANVLKHRFTSPKTDGPDPTQIQPSHWNDGHGFTGGASGDVLMRDLSDPTYGAKWAPAGYKLLGNSDTGTRHDWAPGLGVETTYLQWNGAADISITGLLGPGVQGQVVLIKNRSASSVMYFFNIWPESAPANQLYNLAASGPTPVAVGGWIQFQYLGAWLLIGHEQGAWITPPFNAAEYTGSGGMSWLVSAINVTQCGYRLSGNTLQWSMYLSTTQITGSSGAALFRAIPGNYDARNFYPVVATVYDGTQFPVHGLHEPGNRRIHLIRDAAQSQTFPLGALHLYLSTVVEVV